MSAAPQVVKLDLEVLKLSATAALFEGKERAGIDITMLVVSVHESGTLEQTFLGAEPA